MNNFELVSFADDAQLAEAAADRWLKEIDQASRMDRGHCVALSGGRIARRFFSAAAGLAKARDLILSSVHFFWSDERCVPPSDLESNFAIARELLLGPLQVAGSQIHRIHGEEPPELAAAAAAADLCRIAPLSGAGQPVLDLIFLGMGEDGHVASLFPGESQEVMDGEAVYRVVTAPKPPPRRITIGYAAIAAARQVWVLASGQGKQDALRQSLAHGGPTPLARVLKLRSQTRILTDIPGGGS